jgi:hypothetical protein
MLIFILCNLRNFRSLDLPPQYNVMISRTLCFVTKGGVFIFYLAAFLKKVKGFPSPASPVPGMNIGISRYVMSPSRKEVLQYIQDSAPSAPRELIFRTLFPRLLAKVHDFSNLAPFSLTLVRHIYVQCTLKHVLINILKVTMQPLMETRRGGFILITSYYSERYPSNPPPSSPPVASFEPPKPRQ